jgi:hypothetical protein
MRSFEAEISHSVASCLSDRFCTRPSMRGRRNVLTVSFRVPNLSDGHGWMPKDRSRSAEGRFFVRGNMHQIAINFGGGYVPGLNAVVTGAVLAARQLGWRVTSLQS